MIRQPHGGRSSASRLGVLIVENQALVAGLLAAEVQRQPDMRVCATACDAAAATDLASEHRPDVVLLSAALADRGAFQLLRGLRTSGSRPRTVLLDERVYVAHAREGLRLGIAAYHTRNDSLSTVCNAIRAAAAGETSFCAELATQIVTAADGIRIAPSFRYTPLETLSQRELDVLLLIAQGATVKDCASQLNLSASTVDNHKTRFMRKLNIHRTVDLVRLAIREQLIPS